MTRATLIGLAAVVAVTMTCGYPAVVRPERPCCPAASESIDEDPGSREAMLTRVIELNEKAARIEAQLAAHTER